MYIAANKRLGNKIMLESHQLTLIQIKLQLMTNLFRKLFSQIFASGTFYSLKKIDRNAAEL